MFRRILILFISSVLWAGPLSLLAVTHSGCPVCNKWHEEVKPYYTFMAQKKGLPQLKTLDIAKKEGRIKAFKTLGAVENLPTFAIMDEDKVVATFTGYIGYDNFFAALDKSLKKRAAV